MLSLLILGFSYPVFIQVFLQGLLLGLIHPIFSGLFSYPVTTSLTVYHKIISRRKLIYRQVQKIFTYVHLLMMTSRIAHEVSEQFIILIRGYTSSILCKINFQVICLTMTFNAACKKMQQNAFIENLAGTENLTSNALYHITNSKIKIYIVKLINYSPTYFINRCSY